METLRSKLIRLASNNPNLRPHVLPLIIKVAGVLPPGLQQELEKEVSSVVSKTFKDGKSLYRRMYNTQKFTGKAFENVLDQVIPNYDINTGDFSSNLDPDWVPYIGRVDFDRQLLPDVKLAAQSALGKALNDIFGENLGLSSKFHWDTETEEQFWFLSHSFDVREAKRIIASKPRVVSPLSLEGIEGWANRVRGMNPDTNTVDIKFPVIVAMTQKGNSIPIDGWNRIRKAISNGLTEVPAVFLNSSESKKVRL